MIYHSLFDLFAPTSRRPTKDGLGDAVGRITLLCTLTQFAVVPTEILAVKNKSWKVIGKGGRVFPDIGTLAAKVISAVERFPGGRIPVEPHLALHPAVRRILGPILTQIISGSAI